VAGGECRFVAPFRGPAVLFLAAAADDSTPAPPLRTIDLNPGESQDVVLSDATKVNMKLLDVEGNWG